MKYLLNAVLALIVLLTACSTPQATLFIPDDIEERTLDTLIVQAPVIEDPNESIAAEEELTAEDYELPTFNSSEPLTHDLLHTKLDLRFDWSKEQVIGKATLTLKPYFYPSSTLTLDAKNFEFNKVAFEAKTEDLKYEYDGKVITIDLGKELTRNDTFQIFIDYVATPQGGGGSAAITSDKGLFFINASGTENKPQQIWTQGETEHNSNWFPTFDQPNERCTQEMYLTVENRFKTLSNGLLISSTENEDGTRTDYWQMDQPHAPYLFMIAIGEFAKVQDRWRDVPLSYYVEPEYREVARDIFPYTPEMLEFFSNKLSFDYPWKKYAQVIVRDYVSGAMENTTASIFGEFIQGQKDFLVDNLQNETIVAHEMFHHWFGDYVTCESWANLTMNEGFANYSEYLWLEEKHGRDEADYHRMGELDTYLSQAANSGTHPLIYYGYNIAEDMFDAHSYNKGGLVLHQLRYLVGEEAFWAALNLYLTRNAYSAVEADELRLAFEDVTGQDMIWFFNQWFHEEGHPELKVTTDYDKAAGKIIVEVEQTQDPKNNPPIFQLPIKVDVYFSETEKERYEIMVNRRIQTFEWEAEQTPVLVNFDAERTLLGVVNQEKTDAAYAFQYQNAPLFMDRYEALAALSKSDTPTAQSIVETALNDKFYGIRSFAINSIDPEAGDMKAKLMDFVENDPKAEPRSAALNRLLVMGDESIIPTLEKVIANDPAASVKGTAMAGLGMLYAESDDLSNLSFYEANWAGIDGYDVIYFLESYSQLAAKGNASEITTAVNQLKEVSLNNGSIWRRAGATLAINNLYKQLVTQSEEGEETTKVDYSNAAEVVLSIIENIKANESDPNLQQLYFNIPSL